MNEYDALDEIGNLSRGMNSAVKKIQFLINEVYAEQIQKLEIEKEKDKAELRALMSQVNPHFMFNIFEIVRMKSLKNGETETSDIMKSISTMFRRLVHSGDDIILLNDELKYVFAYLNVCNYSMDNEINISLDIDEAALECKIPKMTIQVFVENAFIHGLENISENRKFFLKVKKLEYSLYICITDNGTGINAETIKAINEKRFKKNKNGRGVGIMNVLKRLSLYYGDDFKFSASSIPFKETKIEIEIPIKKE